MSIEKDLPAVEYHKGPGINSSSLKWGELSMKHMHHAMTTEAEESKSMRMGRLIHAAVLEPDNFLDMISIWPGTQKRGAKWDVFKAQHDPDWIITPKEQIHIQALSKAIHADKEAHNLIQSCDTEVSLFWEDPLYGAAKARPDGLNKNTMLSFKTTGQIKPERFGNTFAQIGYHIQLGWYWTGAKQNGYKLSRIRMISVEQDPPYDLVMYRIEPDQVEKWAEQAVNLAKEYHAAEVCKVFTGVCPGLVDLKLPAWFTAGDEPVTLKIHGEEMEV